MNEIIASSETWEKPLNVYIIAGEPSGDLLGAHLMRSLKALSTKPIFFTGVGGDKMEEEGLDSLFPYHELSMMGFVEILPYIFRTLSRINFVVSDIELKQPDVIITIDSPGFNFRVVEKLRKAGVQSKFVHYVAPTVWAYKPERARKCAELFDHMLLLLPFEKSYFDEVGLPCTFVGHPVICESPKGNGDAFREKHQIPATTKLICLFPGSRTGEIKRHMPIFTRAAGMLTECHPRIAVAVAVPEYALPTLAPYLNNSPFRIILAQDEQEKKDAIAASQFAFVKSGTVAFEPAMAGIPMLVAYRANGFSVWWLRRIIKTKFANLVNIILGREAIPELLQEHAAPLLLASCASTILRSTAAQQAQKESINTALKQLVPEGGLPSDLAARKVLSLLDIPSPSGRGLG